jgi:hypothetical protein
MRISGFPVVLFTATALVTVSCSKPVIVGQVEDPTGSRIADVRISIDNSAYETRSDSNGRYTLPYTPGQFTVRFTKEGYTPDVLELSIQSKEEFPARKAVLLPLPRENHILCMSDKKFVDLSPSKLDIKRNSSGFLTTDLYNITWQNFPLLSTATTCMSSFPGRLRLTRPAESDRTKYSVNMQGPVAAVTYSMGMPIGITYQDANGLEMGTLPAVKLDVYKLTLLPNSQYVLVEQAPGELAGNPTGRAFAFATRP